MEKYNKEIHKLWPKVQAEIAKLSAYSPEISYDFSKIFDDLARFDAEFAILMPSTTKNLNAGTANSLKMKGISREVTAYRKTIFSQISKVIEKFEME